MTYEVTRIPGDGELADAFEIRREVFVDEQDVDEDIEYDGRDDESIHFVITDTETDIPAGTARLRTTGDGTGKPERVAVRQAYRDEGLGRRLMELIETEAREKGCERSLLHAQTHVIDFYRGLGYEVTSEEFEEAGISHVEMEKEL